MSSPFDRGRPDVWRKEYGLRQLPKSPGAYRFVDVESHTVDYIGITSNIYNRISNHLATRKKYNPKVHRVVFQVARDEADWDQLCEWEAEKIGVHRPISNKTRGKNGRVSKVYLDKIQSDLVVKDDESIEDAAEQAGILDRFFRRFRR